MNDDFTESYALTLSTSNQRQKLIDKLIQVWNENDVQGNFQNIFTDYLSEVEMVRFSEFVKTQMELARTRQSFAYTMKQLEQTRILVSLKLQKKISCLESKPNKTEKDIQEICEVLNDLREINLESAELLLDIHRYFEQTVRQSVYSPALAQELTKLDLNQAYLKKSVLRKFILFSKTYDPFFLKHEEVLKTTNNPRLREVRCVEELFTLPVSYAYRLEKIQSSILQYLEKCTPLGKSRLNKFRVISPIRSSKVQKKYENFQSPKLSPKIEPILNTIRQEDSDFKLDKDAYLFDRNKSESNRILGQADIRKTSDDYSDSPNNRNLSVRSMKQKEAFLPRLKIIQSVSNYKDSIRDTKRTKESSTLTKRYNAYKSINEMEERDIEIKNLLFPKKFEKVNLRKGAEKQVSNSPYLQAPSENKIEISVQYDASEPIHINTPEPREISVQTLQMKSDRRPREKQKTIENESTKKGRFKKYQLKASTIPLDKIFQILHSIELNQNYKKILEIGSWENSIRYNQYYFHKFFINEELSAISLCCGLPQGDILIKCWGPLRNCDEEMSSFLFGKYIEHIEKNTICKTIFYNNLPINQLFSHHFIKKKDRIYEHERIESTLCEQGDYYPFLSLNFTSVAINKSAPMQEALLNVSSIEEFHVSKFICFNYLLIINRLMQTGSFSNISAYYPRLPSIKQSNLKILSHFLSDEPYNTQFRCSYCHLLTLKLRNPIKYAFFLADKGYMKFHGDIADETEEAIIICLPFLRYNVRMYFGKGIKSASEMAERCKKSRSQKPEKISFSIRMFKKQLRGRMISINLKQENSYGDFQITFSWKDFLKGKIEHPITDSEQVFDSSFYCLIEMERELLFVFEVGPSDFI